MSAIDNWADLDGWALSSGVSEDLRKLPLDRFINLVWWFFVKDAQPDDVDKMKARLWQPPKGIAPTSGPWSADAEMSAFRSVKAKIEGKVP